MPAQVEEDTLEQLRFLLMNLTMSNRKSAKKKSRGAFRGDGAGSLPRQMIEPYRLWFEFLKTALNDPMMSVERSIYKEWGDVQNADFDDWWSNHWHQLFAEPTTCVSVIGSIDQCQSVLADQSYLLVKVPLYSPSKIRISELEKVVKIARKDRPRKHEAIKRARFRIIAKRTLRRDVLRGMLRLYQLHIQNCRDLEKSAIAYFDWATEWNAKVQAKGWNRPSVYVPPQLKTFVTAIRQADAAPTPAKKRHIKKLKDYQDARSKIRRYVHRAETIARNVSKGVFPGEFA